MSNYSVEEIKAVIFGHAVGDALGVPVEFQTRLTLDADPVTDMRGYGTYPVPAGSWSDDTSMTLCALDALTQESFLWDAVMVNFGRWYYNCSKAPKVLLSSAFGAFLFQKCVVFGAFRSTVSIRSFSRVGHGVGQTVFRIQTRGAPLTAAGQAAAPCLVRR